VEEVLSLTLESRCAIRHNTFSLCCSDLTAKVCLTRLAELAFSAFWCTAQVVRVPSRPQVENILKRYNVISRLDRGDTFANGLYDTSTFMAENDWESSFGILSRQCVCICKANQPSQSSYASGLQKHTYQCGKHRCSRFRFGLRGPLGGQLRCPQW
jgi:hypothetical protein